MDYLRTFYDIMAVTRPGQLLPWEQWEAIVRPAIAEGRSALWPLSAPSQPLMIGGVMFAGDTIHIAVLPDWHSRWATRAMLRAWRDTYTHSIALRAPIEPNNRKAIALAKRLGFKFCENQGLYDLYVKEPNVLKEPTHA